MIKNYMEILVEETLGQLVKEGGSHLFSCTCESCLESMKAIALNALPPLYIALREGEDASTVRRAEPPKDVNVLSKILAARKIVEQNPKHPVPPAT